MYVNEVHAGCRASVSRACSLGACRVSMLPPTAITSLDSDGFWRATRPPGTSPLLVFLNSKSGDSQVILHYSHMLFNVYFCSSHLNQIKLNKKLIIIIITQFLTRHMSVKV